METYAEKLKRLVDLKYYKNKPSWSNYSIFLPVKSFHGLNVYISIIFSIIDVRLAIESSTIEKKSNDCENEVQLYGYTLLWFDKPTKEDIYIPDVNNYIEILNNLKDILLTIKFNKYLGTFEKEPSYNTGDFWNEILEQNPYIEYTHGSCCVCYESTVTNSFNCCKKPICFICWDKLAMVKCCELCENDNENCDDLCCKKRRCPLCRCCINTGDEIDYE